MIGQLYKYKHHTHDFLIYVKGNDYYYIADRHSSCPPYPLSLVRDGINMLKLEEFDSVPFTDLPLYISWKYKSYRFDRLMRGDE